MRVVRRMVGRMVAESSRTTQQQATVTRHGRHIMVVILVHSPGTHGEHRSPLNSMFDRLGASGGQRRKKKATGVRGCVR